MPLEDSNISKDVDGFFNEEYCKWCYADGEYTYHNMDELIEVCVANMANEKFSSEQARAYMKEMLPKLDYWKQYKNLDGAEKFDEFKKQLIDEINALHIEGMPKLEKLNALVGGYINLEYRLPNGQSVKFLDDGVTYLGNQLECEFGGNRCFGIAANMEFILISTYEENGKIQNWLFIRKDSQICGGGSQAEVVPEKKLDHIVAKKVLIVDGMTWDHCKGWVEKAINQIDGASAKVNLKTREVTVSMSRDIGEEELRRAVVNAGYRVVKIK